MEAKGFVVPLLGAEPPNNWAPMFCAGTTGSGSGSCAGGGCAVCFEGAFVILFPLIPLMLPSFRLHVFLLHVDIYSRLS